jgi:xanthine dehydrogenase YagT iron-sulfur-binding subunit
MHLVVNGRARTLDPAADETLLETLRERLHLTGAKPACERGECGACTVLVEGRATYACVTLTHGVAGCDVTTIEGIATGDALHPVQDAFIACDAVQCGFCTPGQVISAIALLRENPSPSLEDIRVAMAGNLCRCGTYPRIVAAIRQTAARTAEGGAS